MARAQNAFTAPSATSPKTGERAALDDKRARRLWHDYQTHVKNKYGALGTGVDKYIRERAGAPFFLSLNAITPVSLCTAFGIKDESLIRTIGLAHLSLDHFTQVLDDLTDTDSQSASDLHLSHCLLMDGLTLYSQATDRHPEALLRISEQISAVMNAERSLWRHKGTVLPFTAQDYDDVANRGGIISCVAIALAAITGNRECEEQTFSALRAATLGVQIADDLLDWESDFVEGTMTWPLVAAITRTNTAHDRLDQDTLADVIVNGGIFDEVAERAGAEMLIASDLSDRLGAVSLAVALRTLADSVQNIRDAVRALRGNTPSNEIRSELQAILRSSDTRLAH